MNEQRWDNPQNRTLPLAICFFLIDIWASFMYGYGMPFMFGFTVFLVLTALVIIAIISFYIYFRNKIRKFFGATTSQGMLIIQRVLDEKHLPYENINENRLSIATNDTNISIQVSSANPGCIITISPTTPENMPLIESLCAKLDEAFTPRGLKN